MTDTASLLPPVGVGSHGWLYRHIPRPRLHAFAGRPPVQPKRVLVFTKGRNASFDYYIPARLKALGLPYEVRCIDKDRLDGIDTDGLLVVICRYFRLRHANWIARNRRNLAGVAYFVDDDIAALVADARNDLGYRLYLACFAVLPMMILNRGFITHLWASTEALASVLGASSGGTNLLHPAPVIVDHLPLERPRQQPALKIVYHATRSHQREHAFLVPVMEEVLRLRPQVRVEVMAKGRAARLWSKAAIPDGRMRILPPMGWQQYYRYSRENGADIALMPLLDGLANDSRADTKLIDCCRMGAAAILSDAAPYRRHRESGCFMVRNSSRQWVEALLALIDDAARRDDAREAARRCVLGMTLSQEPFPGIDGPMAWGREEI